MEKPTYRLSIWMAGSLLCVFLLVNRLQTVATLLLVSWFLAYALDPVIDNLQRKRVPRAVGILLLLLAGVLGVTAFSLLALPALGEQFRGLAAAMPGYVQNLKTELLPRIEAAVGRRLPVDPSVALTEAASNLQNALPGLAKGVASVFGSLFANAWSLVQGVLTALLIPVFTFYLLLDFNGLGRRIRTLFPRPWQPAVRRLLNRSDEVLSAFVRGQLTICAILGLLYSLGLVIVGIDMPWVVGLFSGALFIVPYLGTAVGLVLGSLLALLKFHDLAHLVGVWVVFGVGQSLEGLLFTPRIVGNRVGLHPLAVIVAVMAGGELFGFLGILLAVPAAAVLRVGLDEGLAAYRNSRVYRGDQP